MVKLNCTKKSQVVHKGGKISFVWNNWIIDLLFVMIMTGLVVHQNMCPTFLKAKYMARKSFAYMDNLFWKGVYVLEL